MKFACLLFGIYMLMPTPLNAQQRLGNHIICTPSGHTKFYKKYANLSPVIGETGFTSALSVFYSTRDDRIVGMISDIGLRAKPGGFKLLLEYYPKSADKVQAKNKLLYNDVANLKGKFSSYREQREQKQTTYKSMNPLEPWFVFYDNSTYDDNWLANDIVAECFNVQPQYTSYCRIEHFINDSIQLNIRFPAIDYTSGKLIYNYIQRYVNSEIFSQSSNSCRDH